MLRSLLASAVLVVLIAPAAFAADKVVKGKLVKVDAKKNVLTIKTDDGEKNYDVNDDTKFYGPRGGVSSKGIKDERLLAGVELEVLVAGNNRTLREVRIPEKSK
jgi:hypothetical protein